MDFLRNILFLVLSLTFSHIIQLVVEFPLEWITFVCSFEAPKYSGHVESLPFSEEVCTLIITEVFPEDSGEFKCIAENEAGSAVSTARLIVSPGNYSSGSPRSFSTLSQEEGSLLYLNWWLIMFFRRKRSGKIKEYSKVIDQEIFSKTGLLSLEQWQLQKEQKSRQYPNKPYANYSWNSQSHWIWDPDSKGEFLHHQWKFLCATTTMVRPERPNIHSFNRCSRFCR